MPKVPKSVNGMSESEYARKLEIAQAMSNQSRKYADEAKRQRASVKHKAARVLQKVQDFTGIRPGASIIDQASKSADAQRKQYEDLRREMGWN